MNYTNFLQIQKRAQERNSLLRDAWRVKLLQWRAHQLVFLDESAVNETTLQRRRGWAPIGTTASVIWPFKRSECWSILSAYAQEGFITHDITHGSFTAKMFNNYVEHSLLPPFQGLEALSLLRKLDHRRSLGTTVQLCWVPAHKG